jgi:nucleoside-diphosphate-sugar epimerase
MTLLIAGGSGFLGTALARALRAAGHRVMILTRRPRVEGDVQWLARPNDTTWRHALDSRRRRDQSRRRVHRRQSMDRGPQARHPGQPHRGDQRARRRDHGRRAPARCVHQQFGESASTARTATRS